MNSKMEQDVRSLYIYILKHKFPVETQEINPDWWMSTRSDYCYYVAFEGNFIDFDFYLTKVSD